MSERNVDHMAVMEMSASLIDHDIEERPAALRQVISDVRELVEASREYFICYCVDEADDTFEGSERGYDTGCTVEQHEAAKRLRASLSKFPTADSEVKDGR